MSNGNTETHPAPAIDTKVTINRKTYTVIYSSRDSENMEKLRGGKESYTLGLEGKRGAVYMANFCATTGHYFGGLVRV